MRFQITKSPTVAATATASASSSRIQSSSAPSSSSVVAPPMDSLDQMNAQLQFSSSYLPQQSNWGRYPNPPSQPTPGGGIQTQQRPAAEMTHQVPVPAPNFQSLFTTANIQAYGQGSAPFQAQSRTYNYPGYQPYVYTAVQQQQQQQQQQGVVPAVHYPPKGTVNMTSSPSQSLPMGHGHGQSFFYQP